MRRYDFGMERDRFVRDNIGRRVIVVLDHEELLRAIERGLGIPDDALVYEFDRDPMRGGWLLSIISPRFDSVPEGEMASFAQLIRSETRIER